MRGSVETERQLTLAVGAYFTTPPGDTFLAGYLKRIGQENRGSGETYSPDSAHGSQRASGVTALTFLSQRSFSRLHSAHDVGLLTKNEHFYVMIEVEGGTYVRPGFFLTLGSLPLSRGGITIRKTENCERGERGSS
jgi:hypothetical protein